jgi:hypothetical protein
MYIQSVSGVICNLGRRFFMLNYIYVAKNTYIRNWMLTEILKRKKIWYSYGSMSCTCLTWWLILTLHRTILEPIPKLKHAAARVLCKVLGSLRTIFLKETSARFCYLINVFMLLRCSLDANYRCLCYRNYKFLIALIIYLIINKCVTAFIL